MALEGQTLNEKDPIVTPDDTAEIYVRDATISPKDRRWSMTNLIAWIASKLGTAASANVTTSATDTTAGRVLKVGDFGLGGDEAPIAPSDDLDNVTYSGISRYDSTTTNRPDNNGLVLSLMRTTTIGSQLALSRVSDSVYKRTMASDSPWSAWVKLLHSGNYPSDTAWTTVTSLDNGWTGTVWYIKWAGWVHVTFENVSGASKTSDTVLNIPTAYHPDAVIRGSTNQGDRVAVTTTGNIDIPTASAGIYSSMAYPVI